MILYGLFASVRWFPDHFYLLSDKLVAIYVFGPPEWTGSFKQSAHSTNIGKSAAPAFRPKITEVFL